MTARVLTGSKQDIIRQVAAMEGEVREAIVFVEEPADRAPAAPDTFAEMEPFMVDCGDVDDSREAIYDRSVDE